MTQTESSIEPRAGPGAHCAVRVDRSAHEMAHAELFADSRCHSGGHRHRYSSEAHQIVGSHGELELLIDALQSAKYGLSNPADGLAPTERLLDPLADDLADAVTRMAGRAAIDRAAAAPGIVGRDVRCDRRASVLTTGLGLIAPRQLA